MITLIPLNDIYSIHQFTDLLEIPKELISSEFYSVTKTEDEVSVITNCTVDINSTRSDKNWKGFKVEGILDFSLIGIINDITKPLKDNGISVFVISTYNTDYLFVKSELFDKTVEILNRTQGINVKH